MNQYFKLSALALSLALLSGCATKSQPTYYWGAYPQQIYPHLKAERSPDEQIGAMEQDIEKAKAANLPLPPGFWGHLGLLYGEKGLIAQMNKAFAQEKQSFPESTVFIDFLLTQKTSAVIDTATETTAAGAVTDKKAKAVQKPQKPAQGKPAVSSHQSSSEANAK